MTRAGEQRKRWERWRKDNRDTTRGLAKGRCEVCGARGEEWAHMFGRRNMIGEPLASFWAMTFWLCSEHHHEADAGQTELQKQLRWRALNVAIMALGTLDFPEFEAERIRAAQLNDDPVGCARALERTLRAADRMTVGTLVKPQQEDTAMAVVIEGDTDEEDDEEDKE